MLINALGQVVNVQEVYLTECIDIHKITDWYIHASLWNPQALLRRVSKKLCKIDLSEFRQISTNFDNFSQKDAKEAEIMPDATHTESHILKYYSSKSVQWFDPSGAKERTKNKKCTHH